MTLITDIDIALPEPLTYTYKIQSDISIFADVYIPNSENIPSRSGGLAQFRRPCPILLYIHGGNWIYGSRKQFSGAYFYEFLQRGFVIVSIDYRLLPESDFVTGQMEDIRDVEDWLRAVLPELLRRERENPTELDAGNVIVLGASAGAHLALLTPKLWKLPPTAIISMYGPTNLLNLRPLKRGVFANLTLPPTSPVMLKAGLMVPPPTQAAAPQSLTDFMAPRILMSLAVNDKNVIGEFLVKGLVNGQLPEKGTVPEEDLKALSPYYIAESIKYPPVFQAIGTVDEAFEDSQITLFDEQLRNTGVYTQMKVLEGLGHSFDLKTAVGSDVYKTVIVSAADFVEGFVQKSDK